LVQSPRSCCFADNGTKRRVLDHLFNIYSPDYIHETLQITQENGHCNSAFSFLKFTNTSVHEISKIAKTTLFHRLLLYLIKKLQWQKKNKYYELENWEDQDKPPIIDLTDSSTPMDNSLFLLPPKYTKKSQNIDTKLYPNAYYIGRNNGYIHDAFKSMTTIYQTFKSIHILTREHLCYMPMTLSPPISVQCSDHGFVHENLDILFEPRIKHLLTGYYCRKLEVIEAKAYDDFIDNDKKPFASANDYDHLNYPFGSFIDDVTSKPLNPRRIERNVELCHIINDELGTPGLIGKPPTYQGFTNIWIPPVDKLIYDSGKLTQLDHLLKKLKDEGHRVLIFFQMVKMIDIIEEYLTYRKYTYLRLDGSTSITERNNMVSDWQTRSDLFIFLLSTRAGGLGINLTAADTVIFYDNDWNPTVDQQAMDRCHRLGQTKQVTVYRLITAGTVEERILRRAKQKDQIQKVVISGGEFRQVDFKPREIVSLLLDDDELEENLMKRKLAQEEEKNKKKAKTSKRSKEGNSGTTRKRKTQSTQGTDKPTTSKRKRNAAASTPVVSTPIKVD